MTLKRFINGAHSFEVVSALGRSLAVIEFDMQGKIISANENFCELMGYEPDEVVGRNHQIFVETSFASSAAYKAFWDALAKGKYQKAQFKRVGKNGKVVWIEATYNPVLLRGKPHRVVKVATDITAAKAEQLDNKGKMDALMRAQAIIEFTPDGHILTANRNFLDTLGYELSDIVGRHHSMFCATNHVETDAYRSFWRDLKNGQFRTDQFARIRKDGTEIHIQATYNPIFDDAGHVVKVVKFATDVTGRVVAFNALAAGLERLADCNIQMTVDEPFAKEYEHLRHFFNTSIGKFQETLADVLTETQSVSTNSDTLYANAETLAHRTEQQAAALEQASAALEEITVTVRQTAGRTDDARTLVKNTRQSAAQSMTVVETAITAIGKIEDASREIGNIIDVIDDIAFQTNLLALNAGIEAARAGEAGRGFAVVAQEVRELAQRSASAARKITSLIQNSASQVSEGVRLVGQTGDALQNIERMVSAIDTNVDMIATATREQSSTLGEIASAINQLDQTTQKNAEMVSSNEKIGKALKSGVDQLVVLVNRFKLNRRRSIREPGSSAAKAAPLRKAS